MPETWNIFISYAREDDLRFGYEKEGWVARFHDDLRNALRAVGNREVEIWYDKRLDGNEYFADTIDEATANSSLLVPLVSTTYVTKIKDEQTPWLRRELDSFIRGTAKSASGLRLGNLSRICPVFLSRIEAKDLPDEIRPIHQKYVFYDGNNVRLTGEDYGIRLQILANELSAMLVRLAYLNPVRAGSFGSGA
jgi:hypothetical protein